MRDIRLKGIIVEDESDQLIALVRRNKTALVSAAVTATLMGLVIRRKNVKISYKDGQIKALRNMLESGLKVK